MKTGYTNKIKNYYWNHQDLLGEGGFGKVYKGIDITKKNQPNETVAIKLMNMKEI
jgi:hypothetical protein